MLVWADLREKLEVVWIVALLAAPIETHLQRRKLEGKFSRYLLLRFALFGSLMSIWAIAQTLEGHGFIPREMYLFIIFLTVVCVGSSAHSPTLIRRDNVSKKSEP